MEDKVIRALVVDDYEPWRRFVCSTLEANTRLRVVAEASDGLKAVQLAQELQPDVILLDLGLPKMNGIEAARGIREVSPSSKILFLSDNRSREIADEALLTGALGYVVKTDAAKEMLPGLQAILDGRRYLSSHFGAPDTGDGLAENEVEASSTRPDAAPKHEVVFYSDDRTLLDHLTRFIGSALKSGNAAIVVATESHRNALLAELQAYGVDLRTAIEQGRYVVVDAADALATFNHAHMVDPARFADTFDPIISAAANTALVKQPRVAIFGECAQLLWAQGDEEAAVQAEELANRLMKSYRVDILCGYCVGKTQAVMNTELFQRICAEHSAVHP